MGGSLRRRLTGAVLVLTLLGSGAAIQPVLAQTAPLSIEPDFPDITVPVPPRPPDAAITGPLVSPYGRPPRAACAVLPDQVCANVHLTEREECVARVLDLRAQCEVWQLIPSDARGLGQSCHLGCDMQFTGNRLSLWLQDQTRKTLTDIYDLFSAELARRAALREQRIAETRGALQQLGSRTIQLYEHMETGRIFRHAGPYFEPVPPLKHVGEVTEPTEADDARRAELQARLALLEGSMLEALWGKPEDLDNWYEGQLDKLEGRAGYPDPTACSASRVDEEYRVCHANCDAQVREFGEAGLSGTCQPNWMIDLLDTDKIFVEPDILAAKVLMLDWDYKVRLAFGGQDPLMALADVPVCDRYPGAVPCGGPGSDAGAGQGAEVPAPEEIDQDPYADGVVVPVGDDYGFLDDIPSPEELDEPDGADETREISDGAPGEPQETGALTPPGEESVAELAARLDAMLWEQSLDQIIGPEAARVHDEIRWLIGRVTRWTENEDRACAAAARSAAELEQAGSTIARFANYYLEIEAGVPFTELPAGHEMITFEGRPDWPGWAPRIVRFPQDVGDVAALEEAIETTRGYFNALSEQVTQVGGGPGSDRVADKAVRARGAMITLGWLQRRLHKYEANLEWHEKRLVLWYGVLRQHADRYAWLRDEYALVASTCPDAVDVSDFPEIGDLPKAPTAPLVPAEQDDIDLWEAGEGEISGDE